MSDAEAEDQPGRLEVGAADRRLDRLLDEENRRRAQSVDAGVRRLNASQGNGPERPQAGVQDRQPVPQGPPLVLGPTAGNVGQGLQAGPPDQYTAVEVQGQHLGQDQRGSGMDLLHGAVQHTYQAVRHALGRAPPRQGLLGPLSEGLDPGVQGGLLLSGVPQQPIHEETSQPVRPRALEFASQAVTPGRDQMQVNPFWSPSVTQQSQRPGIVLAVEPGRGRVLGLAPSAREQHVVVAAGAGDRADSGAQGGAAGLDEVERLRKRILREAEEAFAREIRKITTVDGGDGSTSYTSAASGGPHQGGTVSSGVREGDRADPAGTPVRADQTTTPGRIDPPPGIPMVSGLEVTPVVTGHPNEPVRQGDLPPLPQPGTEGSALGFGDWMTVVNPIMCDLSSHAKAWWDESTAAAQNLYEKWLVSTPLEKLRLKPVVNVMPNYQRVEQRGVSMLLATLPDQIRRDIVAGRAVSTVLILYKLHTIYQPGGAGERGSLLKSLTEVKPGATTADILASIRIWRRWMMRALELGVSIPDSLILVQVLTKFADAIAKVGGSQVAYRVASVRQELQIDHRANLHSVMEWSEFLQAECEELSLATTWGKTATTVAQPSQQTAVKAAALNAGGSELPKQGSSGQKGACRYWGTATGCKKGESCQFVHSWEGITKTDRCYACSGEGHFSKDCPTRKDREKEKSANPKRISKVKGTKDGPGAQEEGSKKDSPDSKKGENVPKDQNGPAQTSSTSDRGQGKPEDREASRQTTPDPAGDLLNEATALLKSLRSLKAVKIKQVVLSDFTSGDRMALLDGGATHGLRQALPHEVKDLQAIEVELASGSTWLYKHPKHKTLLSLKPVEVIVPLHRVVSLGYHMDWSLKGCKIAHKTRGLVECRLRGGCPVLPEKDGLALLAEMEEMDAGSMGLALAKDVIDWWKSRFPTIPDDVLKFMAGQEAGRHDPVRCPWNRRQRRRHDMSKGVILNLFSGKNTSSWKRLEGLGFSVINLDIVNGGQFDLHHPQVWAYLAELCRRGRVCAVIGGPPCRSVSRLRHNPPGPRPLQDRNDGRWGLPGLTSWEAELANGDVALVFKQIALWILADEFKVVELPPFFLMESPQDPMDYMPEETEKHGYPSYWCFPEVQIAKQMMDGELIKFDQGPMGHKKRKPTTLLVANAPGLDQLQGVTGDGLGESVAENLEARMNQSKSWAEWSPGLTAAIQESLKIYLHHWSTTKRCPHKEDLDLESSGDSSGSHPSCRRMGIHAWKEHVRNQHQPYRRDCRRCMEMMGVDGKHRRSNGDRSAHVMSVDIVGPMPIGVDVGLDTKQKYFMVATVPIPKIPREGGEEEEEVESEAPVPGEKEENPDLGELEALGPNPAGEQVEIPPLEDINDLNAKWIEHIKELSEPVGVKNITLAEPLESRNQQDVTRVAEKLYCKYKAHGIQILRVHTDRETAFMSRTFQTFCRRAGLWQTMTGGDENPSNGRIEAEVNQVKRRVRLLVRESGLEERYWPGIVRHAGEERFRKQLQELGVPKPPLLPVGSMVTVKTKRWHKAGFGPLIPPFRTMRLMGPSPFMSMGYVLEQDGQIQHARLVVTTDPSADRAVLELQATDRPGKPERRMIGKQPRDPMLPQLPRPLQHEDAALLDGLDHDQSQLPQPGEIQMQFNPDEEDYEPQTPIEDEEDQPALHLLRAGGEWPRPKIQKIGTEPLEEKEGYERCQACGLLQEKGRKICGACEAEVGVKTRIYVPGRALCPMNLAMKLQEQLQQEHWMLKKFWQEELTKVAVGEEEGLDQGFMLEFLENQLTSQEDFLTGCQWEEEEWRLSALDAGTGGSEEGKETQESPHAVLQTYTVPLSQVKRDMDAWRPALEKELNSLTNVTGAIRPIKIQDLPREPGYQEMETVPSKLVPTVKAPDGRLKARIVLCGNLLESKERKESDRKSGKNFELYASGIDGIALRCSLKKAVEEGWQIASLDVTTAFLLAPRVAEKLLVSTPPSILVQAHLVSSDTRWIVEKAVYGLDTSPSDWQQHRDRVMRAARWWTNGKHYWFLQTAEPNMWHVMSTEAPQNSFTAVMDRGIRVGMVLSYVDDIEIMGQRCVVDDTLTQLRDMWRTSIPEWVSDTSWLKFCGLQLRWRNGSLLVGQPDYAREVLNRYPDVKPCTYPLPKLSDDQEEENIDLKDVKKCQAIVGELLWLSTKTRPDLSYAVSYLGSRVAKAPRRVLTLANHVLGYLKHTVDVALEYKKYGGCGQMDGSGRLLGENRVEVYSDASFAPHGERSHQGLMAYWKNSLIHWESKAQPFCTVSTTESELLGYTEGLTLGESLGSIINVLEEEGLPDRGGYVLRGDNQSGIQLLQAPSGPWRTRHLRLRSNVLRERLQHRLRQVEHVPGCDLMVDLLTKAITALNSWEKFYEKVGMVNAADCDKKIKEEDGHLKRLKMQIVGCAAALKAIVTWNPDTEAEKSGRCLSIAAIAAKTAEVYRGLIREDSSKEENTRAGQNAIGPSAAHAEGKGSVEKGWARENEPAPKVSARGDEPASHSKGSLEINHHSSPEGSLDRRRGIPAMDEKISLKAVRVTPQQLEEEPWDGPAYQTLPRGSKDRWVEIPGFWVRHHAKLRQRNYHPLHRSTPFILEDLEQTRITVVFSCPNATWQRDVYEDRWTDEVPRFMVGGLWPKWKGYTFFKKKPPWPVGHHMYVPPGPLYEEPPESETEADPGFPAEIPELPRRPKAPPAALVRAQQEQADREAMQAEATAKAKAAQRRAEATRLLGQRPDAPPVPKIRGSVGRMLNQDGDRVPRTSGAASSSAGPKATGERLTSSMARGVRSTSSMASEDGDSRAAERSRSSGYGGSNPSESRAAERGRAASSTTSSTYDDVESQFPEDEVIRSLREIQSAAAGIIPRGSLAAHYGINPQGPDPDQQQAPVAVPTHRPRYGGDHPLWCPPSDGGRDVEILSQVSETIHGSNYEESGDEDGGFDMVDP